MKKINWIVAGQWLAVFIGGMIGGVARYEVGLWLSPSTFAGTTFVNVIGCFLLTFNIYGLDLVIDFPAWLILGFGTGVVGAFTTFSTFALLFMQNVQQRPFASFSFMLINLVCGFITAALGYLAARLIDRGRKNVW